MIVTSKYVYNHLELGKITDIIRKTRYEHDEKHGYDNNYRSMVWCDVEYLDKLRNKIKVVKINNGRFKI